jgi:Na+/melibiose symporter-like transporter
VSRNRAFRRSLNRFYMTVISSWFAALVVLFAVRVVLGGPTSLTEGVVLMLIGCVPAFVLMVVFRGAPPQTVAEVLRDAERTSSVRRASAASPVHG